MKTLRSLLTLLALLGLVLSCGGAASGPAMTEFEQLTNDSIKLMNDAKANPADATIAEKQMTIAKKITDLMPKLTAEVGTDVSKLQKMTELAKKYQDAATAAMPK